jgi:hypothetical protein
VCKFCKSELKAYGHCIKCGKEICRICASKKNRKIHSKHIPIGGPKGKTQPAPIPMEIPKPKPRPYGSYRKRP